MDFSVSKQKLCSRIRLWEFAEQYILEPLEGDPDQLLSIQRQGGRVHLISELPTDASSQSAKRSIIFGLVGILNLLTGKYLLVVTAREHIGYYHGNSVYRIASMKFLACNADSRFLTAKEKRGEAHLYGLLSSVERTPGLYLSYTIDLTQRAQMAYNVSSTLGNQPLWKKANSRFLWNRQLLEELIETKAESFILPVIQGSFQTIQLKVREDKLTITLIARRCNQRIGTRMWRRGADLEGNVANFVESEQILETKGHVASYVQVRGSVPVLWEQIVDLTYKPKIQLAMIDEIPKVVERHFQDLVQQYGSVIAIDLVNQHGNEAVLGMAYGNAMQNVVNNKIRYVPFDFHRVCGQIRFDRLSALYDQITEDVNLQRYFLMTKAGDKIEEQRGVLRTNCIDCLDRTNVTQSLFGRKLLEIQLWRLGIFNRSETISQHFIFDEKFKILWADHGDNISIQYSGTGALKGDYVRYGKRTINGFLKDGYNALARYYYNNLHDGRRQDALDLVAGHFTVSRGISFPPERSGLEAVAHFPLASALVTTGVMLTVHTVAYARQDTYGWLFSLLWGCLTAGLILIVRRNGRLFCNRPHLCKLL
eukprot:c25451_g1_i1 orf=164-1942(+)